MSANDSNQITIQPTSAVNQPSPSNVVKKYPPRTMLGLSISQILCGVHSIGFGIASYFLRPEYSPAIWIGVLYCVSGSLGIPAARTRRKGFVITYMILSIVCAALCALPFINYIVYMKTNGYAYRTFWESEYITYPPRTSEMSTTKISPTTMFTKMSPTTMSTTPTPEISHWPDYRPPTTDWPEYRPTTDYYRPITYYYWRPTTYHYYYRYSYYNYYYRRGYYVYHKMKEFFDERYGVYSVLVVISLVEAVVAIISAALCCRAVCKECCAGKNHQQQVYYFAASQPMIPMNTMPGGAAGVFTPTVQMGTQPTQPTATAAQIMVPGKKGGYQKGVPIQLIPAFNIAGFPSGPIAASASHATAAPIPIQTQATNPVTQIGELKNQQQVHTIDDTPQPSIIFSSDDLNQPLME